MSGAPLRVAVIGSGISGLAVAYALLGLCRNAAHGAQAVQHARTFTAIIGMPLKSCMKSCRWWAA